MEIKMRNYENVAAFENIVVANRLLVPLLNQGDTDIICQKVMDMASYERDDIVEFLPAELEGLDIMSMRGGYYTYYPTEEAIRRRRSPLMNYEGSLVFCSENIATGQACQIILLTHLGGFYHDDLFFKDPVDTTLNCPVMLGDKSEVEALRQQTSAPPITALTLTTGMINGLYAHQRYSTSTWVCFSVEDLLQINLLPVEELFIVLPYGDCLIYPDPGVVRRYEINIVRSKLVAKFSKLCTNLEIGFFNKHEGIATTQWHLKEEDFLTYFERIDGEEEAYCGDDEIEETDDLYTVALQDDTDIGKSLDFGIVECPKGFKVSKEGVFQDDVMISSTPVVVSALARDCSQGNWALVLSGVDLDGNYREINLPRGEVRSPKFTQTFLELGFDVAIGHEKTFKEYLNSFRPARRIRNIQKAGWFDSNGKTVFCLPDNAVIGSQLDEEIKFTSSRNNPALLSIHRGGTFERWLENIAEYCAGNPIMIFSLSLALASPLLKLLQSAESTGFHLYGRSSSGKTTVLQVASSIWGCGSAPTNMTNHSFVQTWGATANAMQIVISCFNDMFAAFDEIAQCNVLDFQRVVYDLAGGQGKARLNSSAKINERESWRICYLSSGEVEAKTMMSEGNQRSPKAGQLLRLIDIPVNNGIFHEYYGMPSAQFAEHLKRESSENYGHAGPKFLEKLVSKLDGEHDFIGQLNKQFAMSKSQLNLKGLEPEQQRAISRMAVVATAGILACNFGVFPFSSDEVIEAVIYVRDQWLEQNSNLSDSARAIVGIRDYINQHESRFQRGTSIVSNRAGFLHEIEGEKLYLFHDKSFREACNGVAVSDVAKELKDKGLLHHATGKLKCRVTALGQVKSAYYAVKKNIMSYSEDD